ncbi:MAG: aminoglycoside phosphotransferase family protein [Victivallaceae bacterium]|nr:aminoglycoside phosphotransferase family protein [Victivallaceae bacterium]
MKSQEKIKNICSKFFIYGDFMVAVPYGNGNINDTFQVTFDQGGSRIRYILQRINSNVFKNPPQVMENIDRITQHLLRKIRHEPIGGKRRTLRFLRSFSDYPYAQDDDGDFWRATIFIENARSYEVLENEEQAFNVAKAFGQFTGDLSDLPGERLHEIIPDFHDTPKRLDALELAAKEDRVGRAKEVGAEVEFALKRREETGILLELQKNSDIPERITHNDTKANNVLIDDLTGEGVCVIDLDTVMPGLALYDFGDMVRSGCNPAEEDEVNLDNVYMKFSMFEAMLRGYWDSCGSSLTEAEKQYLPFSGKLITLEIGTRFLTDYLNGDTYFKTKRPSHNLERCRNQFKLVESMEQQMDKMNILAQRLK